MGILRHTDKGSYVADNDKQSNVWQKRDLYGEFSLDDKVGNLVLQRYGDDVDTISFHKICLQVWQRN